jgi:hypothetical protein
MVLILLLVPLLITLLVPHRFLRWYLVGILTVTLIALTLLFMDTNPSPEAGELYGGFIIVLYVLLHLLILAIRSIVLWKTKPKATP